MISEEDIVQLAEAARKARLNAYAPYSKYKVGAALLTKGGHVFLGSNVENAAYGLTNCAERSAIFSAVSNGETEFAGIALCLENGGSPCGACRQVMNEFNPELPVISVDVEGQIFARTTVGALLPDAFGPRNLD